jgi:S-formylglutathione hydrolase FrmB
MNIVRFVSNRYSKLLISIILCLISEGLTAQNTELCQVQKIKGEISNDTIEFYISLPASYYNSTKSYPVLYHLHGMNEYYISQRTSLINDFLRQQAKANKLPEVITIFPNGIDGFWGDHYDENPLLETNLIKEIIPYVDQYFRTDKKRILMGWSAGGVGALNFYSKNTEVFNGVISLDGAVLTWNEMLTFQPQKANQITNSDSVYFYEYFCPYKWIDRNNDKFSRKKRTSFFVVASFFSSYHHEFISLLKNYNIKVSYLELNCEHDFNCIFSESKEKLVSFLYEILEDPG